jgi:hypothetical protein
MSRFIQALESRTFMSATLLPDQATITADAAALKVAGKALVAQDKTLLAAITKDLKTLPKTNAPLMRAVTVANTRLGALVNADAASITTASGRLAKKSVVAGDTLISAWTSRGVTTVAADEAALNSILVAPLGKLNLDLTGPLVTDLGVLETANPTASQLATDINALEAAYAANSAALTNTAANYSASITTLSDDLAAIPTVPNIVFDYSGSITQTSGAKKGKSLKFSVNITVEAADGSWSGIYTSVNNTGSTVTQNAQGTVTSSGAFSGYLGDGAIYTGVVSGKTIKGTAVNSTATGRFTVSHR